MAGEIHPMQDRDEPVTAWEPPTDSHVEPGHEDGDVPIPEMPAGGPTGPVTRRTIVFGALFITAALVGLYFLVPKFTGLNQTWGRLEKGDPLWLAVGAGFELLSIAGYAVLFRTVFARGVSRLSWRASIEPRVHGGADGICPARLGNDPAEGGKRSMRSGSRAGCQHGQGIREHRVAAVR